MAETADVHLTLAVGVPLLHAMVARIARDHGVRALLIKGPVLAMQGLREPRQSGDVDVLCEPSGVDAFTQALVQLGWKAFNEKPVTPQRVRRHALGFHHPRWPCGVDVHHRFPGFYAPDQSVFDALWSRRTVAELAAQPVDCTDLLGSAMIHGLHLLRGRNLTLTESDLTHLVETLRRRLDDAAKRELAELAAATGAADTLAPVLDQVGGVPAIGRDHLSAAERQDWNLRLTANEAKGLMWIDEMRTAGLRHWPGIAWRALTFDAQALFEGRLDEKRGTFVTGRLAARRLGAAVRYLPGALKSLVLMRRKP